MFKQGIDTMNFHALKELVVELMNSHAFLVFVGQTHHK